MKELRTTSKRGGISVEFWKTGKVWPAEERKGYAGYIGKSRSASKGITGKDREQFRDQYEIGGI